MTDVLRKDEELTQRIVAIPRDKVFTKRNVVLVLSIVAIMMSAFLWEVHNITSDTNEAVKRENAALLRENESLEAEVAAYEDVIGQAIDAILVLSDQVRSLGGTPPEIVLRPTTTTTTPEG